MGEQSAVLVDHDEAWLDSVDSVVAGAGVVVVGKARSAKDGLSLVERLRPSLLITDLLPVADGIDPFTMIRRAQANGSRPKTIVLSCSEDPRDIDGAFAAGAVAYVLKTAEPDDLVSAVRQVFAPSMFLRLPGTATLHEATANGSRLTPRELEILGLVAEGRSNAQVARLLWVTEQTVKFHLSNIYRKLDVSNRTEAARWAQTHGVLGPAYDFEVA